MENLNQEKVVNEVRFAICFEKEPEENFYRVVTSDYATCEIAEHHRKNMRKGTKWKYQLKVVKYFRENLKGGVIYNTVKVDNASSS